MRIRVVESQFYKTAFVVFIASILTSAAVASALDDMGVTALRAVTTNLNGSGITVGQSEASLTDDLKTWEVNPANADQTASSFTYTSFGGTTNIFPNDLGVESSHGDDVGQAFYGIAGGVATNVARVDNSEADFYYSNYIANASLPGMGDSVVNQSFTFDPLSVTNQQQVDSEYDDYSVQNQTLFISAANNYVNATNVCAPGTSYNCISVGAYYDFNYYNSIGPTIDNGRCKPDITAIAGETSFSTPEVAGAAAVLMQAALRGDGGSDTNSAFDMRTIKALLLNGAVKPGDWTNSTSSPLDARYGTGVLNLLDSYTQLAGGKHRFIVANGVPEGGIHPPTGATGTITALNGWAFNTNSSGDSFDSINHYYFNVTNATPGTEFSAVATLVWNRQLDQFNINNLSLFLYNCANSNLVQCSTSLVDNVQHIYVPDLAQGRYDLQVWKAGGMPGTDIVSFSEPYALAWEFVASPMLAITTSGVNTAITWPLYPAGFLVETSTNLGSRAWSTNNLPSATIANGQNYLLLNTTNTAQFFRLRFP
jgi:hypothetical protein